MKKKIVCWMLVFVMMFSAGCSSKEKETSEDSSDDISTEDTKEADDAADDEKNTDGILIKGKYFTVTLPDEWKDKYIYEEMEEEYGYYMGFYEKESHEAEYGGWLFSIAIPEDATFQEPSYNYIGQIEIDGKEKSMIVVWPTDVQFTDETADAYTELFGLSEDVIYTIEPNDGITIRENEDIFGTYVIPGSDMRYVSESEIEFYSSDELRLARNEIYARHGLIFKSEDLKEFFSSREWYNGTVSNVDEIELNEYEKANVKLIQQMEENIQ